MGLPWSLGSGLASIVWWGRLVGQGASFGAGSVLLLFRSTGPSGLGAATGGFGSGWGIGGGAGGLGKLIGF